MKLLILNAGGERIDGSTIYPLNFPRGEGKRSEYLPMNIGDALVLDSILRFLEFDEVYTFSVTDDAANFVARNGKPDLAIFRGSNYLSRGVDLSGYEAMIDLLDCPILAIGWGVQAKRKEDIGLSGSVLRIIKKISEKSKWIGVRGWISAEILSSIGVKNVNIIGCPSIFRSRKPSVAVDVSRDGNIMANFNIDIYGDYASNFSKIYALQCRLFREYLLRSDGNIIWQGEIEKLYSYDCKYSADSVRAVLQKYALPYSRRSERSFEEKLFVTNSIEKWENFVRNECRAMIGFRLHGNIIALANGIPAVFFDTDLRLSELIEFMGVPYIDPQKPASVDVEDILSHAKYEVFEHKYRRNYRNFIEFLQGSGVLLNSEVVVPENYPEEIDECGPSQEVGIVTLDSALDSFEMLSEMYNKLSSSVWG